VPSEGEPVVPERQKNPAPGVLAEPDSEDDDQNDAPDPEPDGSLSMSDLSEADQQLLRQAGKDISDLDAGSREFLKGGGELSGDAATASTVFSDDETGIIGGPDARGNVDLRATGDGGFVVGEGADVDQGGPPPDTEVDPETSNDQKDQSQSRDGNRDGRRTRDSGSNRQGGRGSTDTGQGAPDTDVDPEDDAPSRPRSVLLSGFGGQGPGPSPGPGPDGADSDESKNGEPSALSDVSAGTVAAVGGLGLVLAVAGGFV